MNNLILILDLLWSGHLAYRPPCWHTSSSLGSSAFSTQLEWNCVELDRHLLRILCELEIIWLSWITTVTEWIIHFEPGPSTKKATPLKIIQVTPFFSFLIFFFFLFYFNVIINMHHITLSTGYIWGETGEDFIKALQVLLSCIIIWTEWGAEKIFKI